jgi:nucleoid-associated protein YgaU
MKHDLYKITFTAPGFTAVTCFMDETPINVSGGYGGWTVTSRLRRTGLTMWTGKDPIRLAVPILFDGYIDGQTQEYQISRLSRMALPPEKGLTGGEPTIVHISGNAIPNPGPANWVIENIQWGTNVVYDFDNNGNLVRMRQDAVVNLIQYVADDRLAFSKLPQGKRHLSPATAGSKGYQKHYTVQRGDTLAKIANKVYKQPKPNDWKLIAKANKIRDPRSIKVGQVLKIPKK